MTSRDPRQLLKKRADNKYSFRVLTSNVPHRHKNSMFCQLCGARYETKQGLCRHSRYVHLVKWCASGQLLALSAAELERLDFDRRRNQLRGGKRTKRIEMKRDASEAEEPETNNLVPDLDSNTEIVEEPVHTGWNETTNILQERPLNLVDIATIMDDFPKDNSQSGIQLSTLSTRMLPFGLPDDMSDMRFNEFRRDDTYLESSSAEIHPPGNTDFNSSEVWVDLSSEGKQPQQSTNATAPEKPIITFGPEDPHIVSITPVSQATKLTEDKQKENKPLNEMVWEIELSYEVVSDVPLVGARAVAEQLALTAPSNPSAGNLRDLELFLCGAEEGNLLLVKEIKRALSKPVKPGEEELRGRLASILDPWSPRDLLTYPRQEAGALETSNIAGDPKSETPSYLDLLEKISDVESE